MSKNNTTQPTPYVPGTPALPLTVMAFKTPKQTLIAITKAGMAKGDLVWYDVLILGFMAGAYIALGGLLAIMVAGGMPGIAATDPGIRKLALGAVFPFGLMLVVLAGAELFTGNTMFLSAAVLSKKTTLLKLSKNWALAYTGNFLGSLFVAYFLAYLPGLADQDPWNAFTVGLAPAKIDQGWGALVLKGIGCNWLVCLSLWLAVASNDMIGKLIGIWWPIMAFVTIGFEHSIANMFFIPLSLFYSQAAVNWGEFLYRNLIPVTLGNVIGGAFFVAGIQWITYAPHATASMKHLDPVPGKHRPHHNKHQNHLAANDGSSSDIETGDGGIRRRAAPSSSASSSVSESVSSSSFSSSS